MRRAGGRAGRPRGASLHARMAPPPMWKMDGVLSEKTLMEIGETLLVHTAAEWREWLAQNHATKKEIWLIYYKKTSGKTGITYEESVEQALCFGWIDGAIKGIDGDTYAGRFTPRRAKSPWSESNRARVARLISDGKMMEAGLAVLPEDLRGGDISS